MLEDSGSLTQKMARKFFKDSNPTCQWGKLIWTSSIPHAKTLVLWKVLHKRLPVDKDIQVRGLFCVVCALCVGNKKILFLIFSLISLSPPRFRIIPSRFFLSSLLFLLMILLIP